MIINYSQLNISLTQKFQGDICIWCWWIQYSNSFIWQNWPFLEYKLAVFLYKFEWCHFSLRYLVRFCWARITLANCFVIWSLVWWLYFYRQYRLVPKYDNSFNNQYVSGRLWLKWRFVVMVHQLPLYSKM